MDSWTTIIMFECYEDQCDNILTSEIINHLLEFENAFQKLEKYKNVCLSNFDNTDCSPNAKYSFTQLFSPSDLSEDGKISEQKL